MKCFSCSRASKLHAFKICMLVSCSCLCVQQLHSTAANQLVDEVSEVIPGFLKIGKDEMKLLPDLTKEVTKFSKVDRHEWLPVKKDRRFKRRKR